MYKLRLLVQLHFQGASSRKAADLSRVSRTTVRSYWSKIKSFPLSYEEWMALSGIELSNLLIRQSPSSQKDERYDFLFPLLSGYAKQLKKRGITIQYLYKQYAASTPNPYSDTQFRKHMNRYLNKRNDTLKLHHVYGDKMFVDYTGDKLEYVDPETGEVTLCEVFVAILPASQLIYVEAQMNQRKHSFVEGCQNAVDYFEGTPNAIVPDNLKSAVLRADRYEPDLNPTFAHFLEYYGMVALPARVARPRDKALVEGAVKIIYQRIYVDVRMSEPHSLDELNLALWEKLEELNDAPLNDGDSRRADFEANERRQLSALPQQAYEPVTIKKVLVAKNGHVSLYEDRHYYSVPHVLIGKQLEMTYTSKLVKLYHQYALVAEHVRDYRTNKYTTHPEHLSAGHRLLVERSADYYIKKAQGIGPQCVKVFTYLLEHSAHPEQGFKSCDGILSLARRHSDSEVELSCGYALTLDTINYMVVSTVLSRKLYQREETSPNVVQHKHIRGGEYYANT